MTSVNSQFRVYFPEHAQHFHHSSVETIVKSIAGEYNSGLPQAIRLLETATTIDASKANPNVRNFVTAIITVLSKTYNLRENSSRFLELKSLFEGQVKAYDASHAIPGAHQADAVAQRRMPQAAAAPHILPQELIGLIGMHVPAQEVARRDGEGASLQTLQKHWEPFRLRSVHLFQSRLCEALIVSEERSS